MVNNDNDDAYCHSHIVYSKLVYTSGYVVTWIFAYYLVIPALIRGSFYINTAWLCNLYVITVNRRWRELRKF